MHKTTAQFPGENNWDAIINHNSLDIAEEREFTKFVKQRGYSANSSLADLEKLYQQFTILYEAVYYAEEMNNG
ncbi:MAG TPA: hypothetical protein VGD05_09720 [Pyrinomonadaceae bacterium]|jgi:hypothetical protein